MNTQIRNRAIPLLAAMVIITAASTSMRAETGTCGGASITLPFTDVSSGNIFFCAIAEAYFTGLTSGTTATTYTPTAPVLRDQMAAFVTRTLDQSLKRGSRRAALGQFWTNKGFDSLALTTVGVNPVMAKSDGADLWVTNRSSDTVSRVRASDGKLLETWTGATDAFGVLCARGKVFVTGTTSPSGSLYQIDPTQPAGAVTTLTTGLGDMPTGIAYDGERIWTANVGAGPSGGGSVSIISLNPTSVSTVTTGMSKPNGILFDGSNIWVTDAEEGTLKKLDSNGAVVETIGLSIGLGFPAFDGANIWVPSLNSSLVFVVRASTGAVVATLSENGLNGPASAAFDGERILVTNFFGHSVSLWKASDLTPIGRFGTGTDTNPYGACSDGLNFWVALLSTGKLARY